VKLFLAKGKVNLNFGISYFDLQAVDQKSWA